MRDKTAGKAPGKRLGITAAVLLAAGCLIGGALALAQKKTPAQTPPSPGTTAESASAALPDGQQTPSAPAGYNEHDYNTLVAFFEQTDETGVSNGKKLDSRYDPREITDAARALGAVWEASDCGELRLVRLTNYGKNSYVQEIPSAPLLAGTLDLSGCTALRELELYYDFPGFRVDGCTALEHIVCIYEPMEQAEIRDCPALKELRIEFSTLRSFRMEGCPAVESVRIIQSPLSDFHVRGAEALRRLYLNDNQLTEPDLSGMPALEELCILRNPLQGLDLTPCPQLQLLSAEGEEGMHSLDLSPCGELTTLYCLSLGITELDLTPCPKLQRLSLDSCGALTRLDLSQSWELVWVELGGCPVTELDLSACQGLSHLGVAGSEVTELDLSGKTELRSLRLSGNPLRSVDLTGCDQLGFYGIRAAGDGAVDLTLSYSQGRRGAQRAAVSAGARPGDGRVFLGWQDRMGKPLYVDLRESEQIKIESGGSFDGLIAVFGP